MYIEIFPGVIKYRQPVIALVITGSGIPLLMEKPLIIVSCRISIIKKEWFL